MLSRILLSYFLFISAFSFGQSTSVLHIIRGRVLENSTSPIPGASIQLLNSEGLKLIRIAITDSAGYFIINQLKPGQYKIKVSYVGFKEYISSNIILNQDVTFPDVLLSSSTVSLIGVTITSTKPLIEQQLDRMVINVENSVTAAGSSALEVLEKSPGVTVDQNGSISMRGKQGVVVMINGKPVQLSGSELAELLRGVSASNVQKIELINNPSARYDAAGSAGIIDIKLKKEIRGGVNGNISLNGGYGKLIKTNNGGNINYRSNKLSLFANYNYAYRYDFVLMDVERRFYNPISLNGGFSQDYDQDIMYGGHTARAGTDYQLGKNTIIGTELFGNFIYIDRNTDSKTSILNKQIELDGFRNMLNNTQNRRNNYGINLNFTQKIDTSGTTLNLDIDYARFILDDDQTYDVSYLNNSFQQIQSPLSLYNKSDGDLNIKSGSINFEKAFKKIRLETGIKTSQINSGTTLDFYNRSNGGNQYDELLSNQFKYRENIQAVYVNLSQKTDKLQFQLGLRLEHTTAKGFRADILDDFKRDYIQLFPSGAISYQVSNSHALGLNFSRRITRPSYNQINPYFYFIDPNTTFVGNPELEPALGYTTDVNYVFKNKYIVSFNYFNSTNPIADIQQLDPNNANVILQKPINLTRYQNYSLVFTIPFKVSKWFSTTNNLSGFYNQYTGLIAGEIIKRSQPFLYINSNNNFTLNSWSAQVIASYNGKQFIGNTQVKPVTTLSFGIQRKLMNKNASIGVNFSDIFWGNTVRTNNSLAALYSSSFWRRDSRSAVLNFSYKFGGKEQSFKRKTGSAEEEKRRAG